jgi:hypothetical protein
LTNCSQVLLRLPPVLLSLFSLCPTLLPSPAMCPSSSCPALLFSAPRAAPVPCPPLPTPRWPSPCSSTSRRRRPSRHACRRACQQLLHLRRAPLGLKARPGVPLNFFYTLHCTALPLLSSSARLPPPELRRCLGSPSTAASAASHPRSNALVAPLPPPDAHKRPISLSRTRSTEPLRR